MAAPANQAAQVDTTGWQAQAWKKPQGSPEQWRQLMPKSQQDQDMQAAAMKQATQNAFGSYTPGLPTNGGIQTGAAVPESVVATPVVAPLDDHTNIVEHIKTGQLQRTPGDAAGYLGASQPQQDVISGLLGGSIQESAQRFSEKPSLQTAVNLNENALIPGAQQVYKWITG